MEEKWDADERKQQKYSLKKRRNNSVYKSNLFSTPNFTKLNTNIGASISDFAF
jgi:hypothetical protein